MTWLNLASIGACGMRRNTTHSVFRKPVPNRVVEIKDISTGGGIVKLKDSLLMLAVGRSYWCYGYLWLKERRSLLPRQMVS